MIRYSTTTTVGIAEKFKKEPSSALEYVKSKKSNIEPSKIDFINVLQVEVHSQVDSESMYELVTSLYPDLTDILGDSEKIGLSIKIEQDTIKKLIYREDEFEDVRDSIVEEYTSLIESPTTNSVKKIKKAEPSTM